MVAKEPDQVPSNGFAERLKLLIEERNYSHRRLAHALGVSKQSVTNWTQGHNEPSLRHLRALAQELDTPLCTLLEVEGATEPMSSSLAASLLRELTGQPVGPAMKALAAATPDLLDVLGRAERYVA